MIQQPSLMTFYGGWGTYQQSLVEMIAPLTPEQLALPTSPTFPSSEHWTLGMIAQHIVANRVWWFQVWMSEGSPELAPIAHWDPQDKEEEFTLNAATLVQGLEATWQMIQHALTRWTADDLEQRFSSPPQLSEEERRIMPGFSRKWIIWHVLEHEIHHGGELSLALGNYGLAGIYGFL